MKNYVKHIFGLVTVIVLMFSGHYTVNANETSNMAGYEQPILEFADSMDDSQIFTAKLSSQYTSEWEKYSTYYYYNQLNENEKNLYDALNAMCIMYMEGTETLTNNRTEYVAYEGLTTDEAFEVGQLFYYSNPQYYFLQNAYTISGRGTSEKMNYYLAVTVYSSFQDGTARKSATEDFKAKIESYSSQVQAESSTVLMEKKAHDLVVDNAKYKYGSYHQSAYGIIVEGEAVCTGYARAFQLLCNEAGIDTILVTSNDHAWNMVRVDSLWYNVDCTWDDPTSSTGQDYLFYNYFNRSDSKILALDSSGSHKTESKWNGKIPVCSQDSGATELSIGTITEPANTVSAPVVTVTQFSGYSKVDITSATSGADIYYTLDGKTASPASSKSTKYTGSFTVDSTKTLSAIAVYEGEKDSSIVNKAIEVKESIAAVNAKTPVITSQPQSASYTFGNDVAALAVKVSDTDMVSLSYQWYKASASSTVGTAISGATKRTYTPDISKTGTAYYYCIITNTDNSVTGNKTATVKTSAVKVSVNACSISNATISAISAKTYTGSAIRPIAEVKMNSTVLTLNKDYTVTYSNNINAGTATVTVKGTGNYTGSKKKTFTIKKRAISSASISTISSKVYTGKALTPTVAIKYSGTALKKGTDYTVSYSNNTKVGTAVVTIKGKGNFSGTKKVTFSIKPAKVSSVTLKSAKAKTVSVTIKKAAGATGYEISYATKKTGSYKIAGTTTKTSYTIKNMKSKQTYYVRVRGYSVVSGKKVYGEYSKVVAIKVK